ncbi:MAG: hypothetical protein WD696_08980 [Bryobacteraceae bacterium]
MALAFKGSQSHAENLHIPSAYKYGLALTSAAITIGQSSGGKPLFITPSTVCSIESGELIQSLLYFLNGVGHKCHASRLVNGVNELLLFDRRLVARPLYLYRKEPTVR